MKRDWLICELDRTESKRKKKLSITSNVLSFDEKSIDWIIGMEEWRKILNESSQSKEEFINRSFTYKRWFEFFDCNINGIHYIL